MSLRTIMIFPEFKNMEIIDNIRKQYDPLAKLVKPHITLVFPFESPLSNEELKYILDKRLEAVKPFDLTLGGMSKQEDIFGNFIFLNVLQGAEILEHIHRILYDNEFKEFDIGLQYIPHMTLGKLPTVKQLHNAFQNIHSVNSTFSTIVEKISVEMISDNEESIIVIEKELDR